MSTFAGLAQIHERYNTMNSDYGLHLRALIERTMSKLHPLEYLVWKQEQEDERMSQESTDNVTSGEENI